MIAQFYKKKILKNKNNKFFYYLGSVWNELKPSFLLRSKLDFDAIESYCRDNEDVMLRVAYYNKLEGTKNNISSTLTIEKYKMPSRLRVYYFDSKII